ncbi:hypothetical protein G8C92_13820 [Paenibacillus donghaensis]|uniref:hypothetical protein n=1 Tax=Paenibacillus donghaensis TaxID=414771 RepID=UPI001883F815|nr:hypothetical protein [Paenibacillus donghaensis]MBE9915107.1 hypothetical protein [Paenibacillus donghaensis]
MNNNSMLCVTKKPFEIKIKESCGLAHDPQVIEVEIPEDMKETTLLTDSFSGARIPLQPSRERPGTGYLYVQVNPFARLKLFWTGESAAETGVSAALSALSALSVSRCRLSERDGSMVISNGLLTVQVPLGKSTSETGDGRFVPGPVERFKAEKGAWRGGTFFDTSEPVRYVQGQILEEGPLRIHYRYRAKIGLKGFYEADLMMDAGCEFVRIEERFAASAGDQLVWDFGPDHMPEKLHLLDSTAGYTVINPQLQFDQRHARLSGWTQYSQLFDLSDGYAIRFREGDCAGFVALEGGDWRGGRLNHIELWSRRWWKEDPGSRRNVPWEAKADGSPGPDRIISRGEEFGESHLSAEAWIGSGRRKFALIAVKEERLLPAASSEANDDSPMRGCSPALGHFESKPDRERYRAQQGLLRKIHTQYGIMPLQAMCSMIFEWPQELISDEEDGCSGSKRRFGYPHSIIDRHLNHLEGDVESYGTLEERIRVMTEFLEARVYGFWEGSGSAYTNCVVSRRIAPEMLHFEWLAASGRISAEQVSLCRAHFSFLAYLFASDHYYPGNASMLPAGDPDSLNPTLAGMANQNFYTDTFNIPGMFAQAFPGHPEAGRWRALFGGMWSRQMKVHMYPESGVWEESHTYYQHVLHTVLPTLLRRRADGVEDGFESADLRKLLRAALTQFTPRHGHMGGRRHLVAFGDHAADPDTYKYLYAAYADAVAEIDPKLAGQLFWLFREMGGDLNQDLPEGREIPAVSPPWRNEYVQGLGFMFRGTDASGQEALLALRSGGAWGHHHNDDASIQFFAKGRALVVDAAFGYPQASGTKKYNAHGHSRFTLRDYEPIDYLWRFNRGWLAAYDENGPFPFAKAYSPVLMHTTGHQQYVPMRSAIRHTRTVVQLAPASYLILDAADTALPQTVRFHVPGSPVCLKNGEVQAEYEDGCRLHLISLDEDILPSAGTGMDIPIEESSGDGPWHMTTEIRYSSRDGQPFFAFMLTAVRPGEAGPSISGDKNQKRLRGDEVDVVLSFPAAAEIRLTDSATGETRTLEIY